MKRKWMMMATVLLVLCTIAAADRLDAEKARLERNKQAVIGFYTTTVNEHDPESAVRKYVGAEYRQHNPFAADGKEAFIAFFKERFQKAPNTHMEIKRVIAEGDLVAVHVHHLDPAGGKGRATIDIFRLDQEGKIVEHWDVSQQVPADNEVKNKNTMF